MAVNPQAMQEITLLVELVVQTLAEAVAVLVTIMLQEVPEKVEMAALELLYLGIL